MGNQVKYNFTAMFNESQAQLNRQFDSFANLKKYAEIIMGTSSIIISFFATFKIFDNMTCRSNILNVLLVSLAVLYIVLMLLAINLAMPSKIMSPIQADKDGYIEAYADITEEEVVLHQFAMYIKAIQYNESVLIKKHKMSIVMGYCLCAVVILILIVSTNIL